MRYLDIFTPDSVIAASVPFASEDPREVAYNNAAYALDRDDVHMLYAVEGKKVFYIAASSEDFASHLNAVTPLAAALPGNKGHQGDGAYIAISESGYAVVIKKGEELLSYVGDRQSVDAFIASHNVPTFSANDAGALPWEGYRLGALKRADRIARLTIIVGFVLAMVSFGVWMGLRMWRGDVENKLQEARDEARRNVSGAVEQLSKFTSQPVLDDIKELQRIIALSANAGGIVNYFKIESGQRSWQVELPPFVLANYIEQFDRAAVSRLDDKKNVVVVELKPKGNKP
ncbi:MAG: hypothetical protein AB7G80_06315 [Dongiaceae bacterium]